MLSIFVLVLTGEHFFHLHQWLFSLTGEVLPTFFSQYFQLIWYIISGLFFLAISFCVVTAFLFLPAKLKLNFASSSLLYASGVVLKLMVQPAISVHPAYMDVLISLTETFSLLLQMIAIIVFLHALVSFYLQHVKSPDIRLTFFCSTGRAT